jgi:prefoldin subunit 5
MAIKSLKQAQTAIDELQGQMDELNGELVALKSHKHPWPPKPDTSKLESAIASLDARIAALSDQVTDLAANAPVPDGDALIKALENKGVMLRKS